MYVLDGVKKIEEAEGLNGQSKSVERYGINTLSEGRVYRGWEHKSKSNVSTYSVLRFH